MNEEATGVQPQPSTTTLNRKKADQQRKSRKRLKRKQEAITGHRLRKSTKPLKRRHTNKQVVAAATKDRVLWAKNAIREISEDVHLAPPVACVRACRHATASRNSNPRSPPRPQNKRGNRCRRRCCGQHSQKRRPMPCGPSARVPMPPWRV